MRSVERSPATPFPARLVADFLREGGDLLRSLNLPPFDPQLAGGLGFSALVATAARTLRILRKFRLRQPDPLRDALRPLDGRELAAVQVRTTPSQSVLAYHSDALLPLPGRPLL